MSRVNQSHTIYKNHSYMNLTKIQKLYYSLLHKIQIQEKCNTTLNKIHEKMYSTSKVTLLIENFKNF